MPGGFSFLPLPYCVAERYATMAIFYLAIPLALPIAVLIALLIALPIDRWCRQQVLYL